jgi:hypothetical protein
MADGWIVVEDKPKAEHYDKRAFHGKRKGKILAEIIDPNLSHF